MEKLEVVACFDWLENEETVGWLGHESLRGSDVYSFQFSKNWLQNHSDIILGKGLQNFPGIQYSQRTTGIFGCFADTLPDRWGRRLIDLRYRQQNIENGDSLRTLSDWDYLKDVEDVLRIGAFRFKEDSTGKYINVRENFQVPPILSLNELMEAANEIEKSTYNHTIPEQRWVQRLFYPGSSVGGARPKACIADKGLLYIAKFPSIKDDIDISKWECFAHKMAKKCGVMAAETKLISSRDGNDILLSKRFDRTIEGRRIHMASSLSLLGLSDGAGERTGNGYLDIVEFIISHGCNVQRNLEELYRRVAFNICIGNSDDHFRNHSFLLKRGGWELSPAYDMNPTLDRYQALLIDERTNEASLDILYKAHKSYLLDEHTACGIIKDVVRNMNYWKTTARSCGIPTNEINILEDRIKYGIKTEQNSFNKG